MNRKTPLSARSKRSISINGKPVPLNRQQPVSKEELDQLKERKNELLDEKKLLKSRIARLQVQTKRAKNGKPISTTTNLTEQLQKEYKSLKAMIKSQKNEIYNLVRCDMSAVSFELQEEAKIVFLERNRLQEIQLQQQIELNNSQKELEDLVSTDGPEIYKKQQKKISHYDNIIKRYKEVNSRYTKKIKAMRSERAMKETADQEEIRQRSEELERQISEAKEARKAYEEKLKKSQDEHEVIMQQLREKLEIDE